MPLSCTPSASELLPVVVPITVMVASAPAEVISASLSSTPSSPALVPVTLIVASSIVVLIRALLP